MEGETVSGALSALEGSHYKWIICGQAVWGTENVHKISAESLRDHSHREAFVQRHNES